MDRILYVGYRFNDYVSKKTNRRVVGYNVYINYTDNRTQGFASEGIWLSEDDFNRMMSDIPIGSDISISYDRYGRVTNIYLK